MLWYEKSSAAVGPVLSTRVRFARNLEGVPFPHRLGEKQREEVWETVRRAWEDREVAAVPFKNADSLVKEAYVQTRQASPALAKAGAGSGLLLSRDGEVSIMVNEEDHLRLQAISAGKALRECCDVATEWMRHGEERLSFAFRKGLGYLTSCPTNLGAAMRLSVMIHLPALHRGGAMPALIRSLNDAGFAVRGLFGEHSREGGSVYQISNQNWREKTPEEILYHFEKALEQVEAAEWKAEQALLSQDRLSVEDAVSRALGILKYAKKMSYGEFITHYSTLRMGRVMGLEEVKGTENPDRLFIELMPAPLELGNRALSDAALRDQERARRLREYFSR